MRPRRVELTIRSTRPGIERNSVYNRLRAVGLSVVVLVLLAVAVTLAVAVGAVVAVLVVSLCIAALGFVIARGALARWRRDQR